MNKTASFLKIVGIIIWVIGGIGSFVAYGSVSDLGYYFEGIATNVLLVALFNSFTSGLTFYALGNITEILYDLKKINTTGKKEVNKEDEVLTKF